MPAPLLIRVEEPQLQQAAPPAFALFALGFRPFYLLAALWAALSLPLWLAQFFGLLPPPQGLPALLWHAHEMVFGFAAAVIVGFLFTAARNWTGLPTPQDRALAALAALWCGARIALYHGPSPLALVLDGAFLPLAAWALGCVLWRSRNRRNDFIVLMLLALSACNLVFHLRSLGLLEGPALQPLHAAMALVTMLCTVMAGRLIPGFSANTLRGLAPWQPAALQWLAILSTLAALTSLVLNAAAPFTAALCTLAALLQALRCLGWKPWATLHHPLLWSLHLAHLWLPVALALAALACLGWLPHSLAWHALGLGLIGGLIMAMITRSALGHSGHLLHAGPYEIAAYVLLQLAVLLRVVATAIWPSQAAWWLGLAMLCWSSAFLVYFYRYAPLLWRARRDGRAG